MLDGIPLVDAHVHVPLLTTLRPAWIQWARDFGPDGILEDVWDAEGRPRPERLDELFADQGVDVALLFCEYSPEATGIQSRSPPGCTHRRATRRRHPGQRRARRGARDGAGPPRPRRPRGCRPAQSREPIGST